MMEGKKMFIQDDESNEMNEWEAKKQTTIERENILFSPISSLNRFIMLLFIHNITHTM